MIFLHQVLGEKMGRYAMSLWRVQKFNQVMLPWIFVFSNANNQEKHLSEALAVRQDATVREDIASQGPAKGSQYATF